MKPNIIYGRKFVIDIVSRSGDSKGTIFNRNELEHSKIDKHNLFLISSIFKFHKNNINNINCNLFITNYFSVFKNIYEIFIGELNNICFICKARKSYLYMFENSVIKISEIKAICSGGIKNK